MALETNTGRATFVNIKEGKLYTKEKEKEPIFFDAISGVISGVVFKKDEYQGNPYEKMELTLFDGEEKYILSMRVDSGYFRGFCNSLRTGKPTERVRVAPNYKIVNDKPQTTCFVSQNNKPLKHAFTKDNMGNFPQVERITFKGNEFWDGSKQIEYWKDWLSSIEWKHEFLAASDKYQPKEQSEIQKQTVTVDNINNEENDDLPF